MWLINFLVGGVGYPDVAMNLIRGLLGLFFAISGYHKLFNQQRHLSIHQTMIADRVPFAAIMCWFVPTVEFFGGMALVVGLLSSLAALGLFSVCLVATCVDGVKRIPSYHPIDKADYVDDVLYLPEVLYIIALLVPIFAGPGSLSLDHLIQGWLS